MGKGLIGAVEEVFPGILFFICHFHFLRDIGKDLLADKYRDLRNRLTKVKIRGALRNKAKDFEEKLGKEKKDLSNIGDNPELAPIKTALLHIYWMFDTSSLSGYGFPFDMKHFIFYQRLIAEYEKIKQLYDKSGCKPFYQLIKILNRVINDKDLKEMALFLKENEAIFNELREALRITLKNGKQGLNDEGEDCDMKYISNKVSEFTEKYNSSENKYHQKMIEQIEKYYEKLFADPIKVMICGEEVLIQPQRTNNVMEQFFRYLKRLLRKKSGNISVKRSLTAMLPGTVLIKNLENEKYLELLLDGTSGLEERFAQVDSRLFLREFSEMKLHNRKIPVDAKKLIKIETMPEKIGKLFLAIAI